MAPPSSPALMEIAGRLYAQHGWKADATRCFTKTLELDPKRTTAALQLAALETESGNEQAATSSAGATSVSNSLLMSALRQDEARNAGAAIHAYEEALKKGDSTGVAANNLAWIYAQSGTNLDRALQLAQRAREANPLNPAVTDTLGFVLLKRHEYSLALTALKHADELLKTQKTKDTQLAQAIHAHLTEASKSAGELTPE
jgi:tetratricopeptide (TPR) repeat protein